MSAPVRIRDFNGEWVSASSENISEGGVRICLDFPLLEGSPVDIEIRLGRESSEGGATSFGSSGTVAWCNEDLDVGFQAGISFSSIDSTSLRALRGFLSSL